MKKYTALLTVAIILVSAYSKAISKYEIYPVPRKMVEVNYPVFSRSLSGEVSIVAEDGIDETTLRRAEQILSEHGFSARRSEKPSKSGTNLYLGISDSKGVADLLAGRALLDKSIFGLDKAYDRHILCIAARGFFENRPSEVIDKKDIENQILVLGENTDAVFCGLASLEQILDQGLGNRGVSIYDWADVKHRGVIEGYYGVPYSAAVTKDLFRFMARYKLNTYMYGAKSDPYHSRYWSQPYPLSITSEQERIGYLTQDMMKDITSVARECKVDFIWAIHPGKAFAEGEDKDVIEHIMNKFESMYSLGIRQFGVFVDDVGVSSDPEILKLCADNLTLLQNTIDKRWNSQVKPLHYVPQLYAYSWADEDKGRAFFTSLNSVPSKINIYITGANVWSVPNAEDVRHVAENLGLARTPGWWWNYLCNDQDMTKLFIADMYTNFRDESHIYSTSRMEDATGLQTLIVNPMQQGELSKIGLFSVGDYAWNPVAFNNYRSWEKAVEAVVGKDRAVHLKNIIPALRYYDNDQFEYLITRYRQSVDRGKPAPGPLLSELRKINASCKEIMKMKDSSNESDRLFFNDIRPWLLKLEAMTSEAVALLEKHNPSFAQSTSSKAQRDYGKDPDFRFEILGGMGEHIQMAERTAEPAAKCLLPFIYWLREQ